LRRPAWPWTASSRRGGRTSRCRPTGGASVRGSSERRRLPSLVHSLRRQPRWLSGPCSTALASSPDE
jgi:hypothetical protein